MLSYTDRSESEGAIDVNSALPNKRRVAGAIKHPTTSSPALSSGGSIHDPLQLRRVLALQQQHTVKMDATLPATRRSRKSTTGLSPRKAMDKENATVDVASTLAANRKKSRSKSIGPGGLDVLKSGTGNRRVVGGILPCREHVANA